MAALPIQIQIPTPDPSTPTQIGPRDCLEITFTKAVAVFVQPNHLSPPFLSGRYTAQSPPVQTCATGTVEDLIYSWLPEDGSPANMHTIHIGSGLGLLRQLEGDLGNLNRGVFCECWPCAERLIEELQNLNPSPIPAAVRKFLELLLKAGDVVYKKECAKER